MPDCWLELTRIQATQLEADWEQAELLSPTQTNNSAIETTFPEFLARIPDQTVQMQVRQAVTVFNAINLAFRSL